MIQWFFSRLLCLWCLRFLLVYSHMPHRRASSPEVQTFDSRYREQTQCRNVLAECCDIIRIVSKHKAIFDRQLVCFCLELISAGLIGGGRRLKARQMTRMPGMGRWGSEAKDGLFESKQPHVMQHNINMCQIWHICQMEAANMKRAHAASCMHGIQH